MALASLVAGWAAGPVHWAEALVGGLAGGVLLVTRRVQARLAPTVLVYVPVYLVLRGWWRPGVRPWLAGLLLIGVAAGARTSRVRLARHPVLWSAVGLGAGTLLVLLGGLGAGVSVVGTSAAASVASVGVVTYVAAVSVDPRFQLPLRRVGCVALVVVLIATAFHARSVLAALTGTPDPSAAAAVLAVNQRLRLPGVTLKAGRAEVDRLLRENRFLAAKDVSSDLARRCPDRAEALLLHGRVLSRLDDGEALTWLARAVQAGSLPVDDQRFVAEQLVMTGWVGPWAAAWSHLGTAGDWLYSRPSYAFRLAVALRTRGELAEASEILRRIQGRVPEGWRLYELGRIAEDEGDVRRAAAWYRKSAREPAGPPEASRRLGAGGRAGPGEFDLAGAVRFEAWSFHPAVVAPQEPLRVILRLKALEFLPEDYRIFVHFEESLHPRSRFQADHDPQGGRRPTTTWLPGETVTDTALVVVPPGVAPGKYRVVAGLFVPMGDKPRLGSAGQQKIELGWITVREPSATTAPPSHRPNGGVSSAGPS